MSNVSYFGPFMATVTRSSKVGRPSRSPVKARMRQTTTHHHFRGETNGPVYLTTGTNPVIKPSVVALVPVNETGYVEGFVLSLFVIMVGCTFAYSFNVNEAVHLSPPEEYSLFDFDKHFTLFGVVKKIASAFIG